VPTLQDSPLAQADEAAGLPDDEVVEELDPEDLAGGRKTAREGDVFGRGLRIAAGVVVRREDRGGGLGAARSAALPARIAGL
jgi:hypothetical protein